MATGLFLALFVVMLLLGVPIAFSIGVASLAAAFVAFGSFDGVAQTAAQKIFSGLNSFSLEAIPFFILSGILMGRGGIARRLIEFADALVGRLVGGLGHVCVLASMFFGAVSGSAAAAVSSIGTALVPQMRRAGYDNDYSVSLSMTAATLGLLIPPSNIMIVYSVAAGQVSIAAMFLAGILPGVLIGLLLMAVNGVVAWRRGYPRAERVGWREVLGRLRRATLSLLLVVIVLGGILGGVFTATEAAAVAVVYSLWLSVILYRQVGWRELPSILLQTAVTTAFVFFLIAASSFMGYVFTALNVPERIGAAMLSLTQSRVALLLLINAMLLVVGVFMDMTPAVLIFTPIFLPIVCGRLGLDPLHFGIILIANLCIGLCTPPVGTILFLACAVGRTTISRVVRPLVPFYAAMIAGLLIITYVPEQWVLWLPRMFAR